MSIHRCIGIFTAGLDDEYQASIWHAMEQEASRRGLGTISFIGSRLGSPIASEASSNLAYNLASRHNIDGLIVIASSLATFFSTVDLHQFFSRWSNLPSVSIGMHLEGMSDVTVEGGEGMRTLVEHLLAVHGRRHIAVVKGPVYHQESISRFDTVAQVLEEHSIPLRPSHVLEGEFTEESGRKAVRRLVEEGTEFDALVCLNDWMALGALEELTRSGIRVPDDVSVVGFDGLDPARYATPPLTTVAQPLYEMGILAVDMLDRLMAGGGEEHICLPCTPVIRESCGCNPHVGLTPGLTALPQHATAAERMASEDLIALMAEGDYDSWIARLNRALDATAASSGALYRWQDYLSVIEYRSRGEGGVSREERSIMMAGARTLVGEKLSRFQAAKRVAVQKSFDNLRIVSATLSGTFESEQLIPNLRESLQQFDLDEGYLVSFTDQRDRARLVMTTHTIDCDEALARSFPLEEILPSCLPPAWRRRRWVLLPLVYLDEPMGYLLVPFGMVAPELYAVLQEQISATWKGSLLLQQIRDHERTLEEQVERRTDDLRAEVKRRIELENEVMEIATKTMERIGQDLHDDLCQYILGISLLATSANQKLIEQHGIHVAELEEISGHLDHAISKVRTISRGLMPLELSSSSFVQRLEALVSESLRHAEVEIDINIDPAFTIADSTRELNLFRIVQEALTNAIKHSRASHIEVSSTSVRVEGGVTSYTLSIRDDGIGLARKPNIRGLGMRIMKNRAAMADALLTVESSSDGTLVTIAFKEDSHA
jgi:DNA-binding LacI/PurR family transcriptional regulator/signal transduction histidine kinase